MTLSRLGGRLIMCAAAVLATAHAFCAPIARDVTIIQADGALQHGQMCAQSFVQGTLRASRRRLARLHRALWAVLALLTTSQLLAAEYYYDNLTCHVLRQLEDSSLILIPATPRMLPGMELVLMRGKEALGRARLERIDHRSGFARLIEGAIEGSVADVSAAPLPFPVTVVAQPTVYVHGPSVLTAGDMVTIARDRRLIAVGRFEDYQPMRLTVLRLAAGEQVKGGDLCYLGCLPGSELLAAVTQQQPDVAGVEQPPVRAHSDRPVEPATATVAGATGLIRVPSADVVGDGEMRITWTPPPSDRESPGMGGSSTYSMTVGMLPRSELTFAMGEAEFAHDMTFAAKLQLREQSGGRPALAVGVVDMKRTGFADRPTGYVVATKRMSDDRLALSLGGAIGESSGVMAGVGYRLTPALELQAEYDTRGVNVGVAARLGKRLWLRAAAVDVGTAITAAYQLPLGHSYKPPRRLAGVGPSELALQPAADAVQRDLVALGLENVVVAIEEADEQRLVVAYENRRFTLNELDALSQVLRVAARRAPASVAGVVLIARRLGLSAIEVKTAASVYRSYARGEITRDAFASQLGVSLLPAGRTCGELLATTSVANRSYGHADVTVSPSLRSIIGTETTTLQLGWYARPQMSVPFGRGLLAEGRWSYPVCGPLVREQPQKLTTERAVLAYACRPMSGWLAQMQVGRFPTDREGVAVEVIRPHGGRGLWHGTWAALDRQGQAQRPYFVGEYRYLVPRWDTQVRAYAGRFLDEDSGWGLDVVRYFDEVQFGIGVRDTTISRTGEVRLVVPLGPRRQPRCPSTIRVCTPDFFDHRTRSVISGKNYVHLATSTGNELNLGWDLVDDVLNRGRHLPAWVRRHLE